MTLLSLLALMLILIICNCNNNYTIHIVPHSHIDVGWGWTINDYYNNRVNKIYNTIYNELSADTKRIFVICEITYFKWWYYNQTLETRTQVQQWSNEGRIEFVGGGMTMNDEALPSYQDIITNYQMGFEFIKKEFNTKPKVGWFLDPFGHSEANTYLMHKLGFKQNVIGRLDYNERAHRTKTKTSEFIWKTYNNEGTFTHALPYHYDVSGSYQFAFERHDLPIKERVYNKWAKIIAETIYPMLNGFDHNQFLLIVGHDFSFMKPNITYPVLDFITSFSNFTYMNQSFQFIYSTPSNYFNKVNHHLNMSTLLVQSQFDCFPLQDNPQQYWSGYYTSRPYLKGSIKLLSNTYTVSSVLMTELLLKHRMYIDDNRDILSTIGIMQHHDTITGTSNEGVSLNYTKIINEVLNETKHQMKQILNSTFPDIQIKQICLNNALSDDICQTSFTLFSKNNSKSIVIGVVNPLIDGDVLLTLEFNLINITYEVYDDNNHLIPSDMYCITDQTFQYGNKCFMSFFYLFRKKLDIVSFTLKVNTKSEMPQLTPLPKAKTTLLDSIGLFKTIVFDPQSLTYSIIFNRKDIKEYNISLRHGIFPGYPQNKCEINIDNNDGMYIFAPCTNEPILLNTTIESSYLHRGNISSVVILHFESSYLITSFYYYPVFIKVDSIINPIPQKSGINYAMVIDSNIKNNITLPDQVTQPEFWTDSNGMHMIRRIKQFRHMFPYKDDKTVAGNFYPITEAMSIRQKINNTYDVDQYANLSPKDRMITVYNDRPQSGGVLKEGQIIILLSRTSTRDDDRGIGSKLYERQSASKVFKVQHIIMLGKSIYHKDDDGIKSRRFMDNHFRNTPMLFSTSSTNSIKSHSLIAKYIHTSSNVLMHFRIDTRTQIIIQFYCMYDYYYNSVENSKQLSSKYFGIISLELPNDKYKVRLEKLNGKEIKHNPNKGFTKIIKENDFLVVQIELMN